MFFIWVISIIPISVCYCLFCNRGSTADESSTGDWQFSTILSPHSAIPHSDLIRWFQPGISCFTLRGTLHLRLTYTLCHWHLKSTFWLQGSSRSISMYWLSLIKIQQHWSRWIVQPHCSCSVVAGIHIILLWLLGGSHAYLHFNFPCCRFKEERVK